MLHFLSILHFRSIILTVTCAVRCALHRPCFHNRMNELSNQRLSYYKTHYVTTITVTNTSNIRQALVSWTSQSDQVHLGGPASSLQQKTMIQRRANDRRKLHGLLIQRSRCEKPRYYQLYAPGFKCLKRCRDRLSASFDVFWETRHT